MRACSFEVNSIAPLSMADFKKLGTFINSSFGIKMPDVKRGMVESRLRKRLHFLDMDSYSKYCDYLFSLKGMENELTHFIDAITTNKTDFFREPDHFSFLVKKALPPLLKKRVAEERDTLRIWCCASSRGHEPYTIAMVLSDFFHTTPGYDFSILATDISSRVLDIARKAVYDIGEIDPVPMALRKSYILKSKDKKKTLVRMAPKLRKKVCFKHLNLMDNDFKIKEQMDIIFCRNVIIYFEKETTNKLLIKLCNQLAPEGFLFMGHSELLDCSKLPLIPRAPAVYQKIG